MGVEKQIIKEGSGPTPQKGQYVLVHCTGSLENGSKFWSTKDPGQQPFEFQIGMSKVIRGWDEGCLSMKKGEVATLICTEDYAYGAAGFPAWGIPPRATLRFEIEILSIR